jgi:hypothetical protein
MKNFINNTIFESKRSSFLQKILLILALANCLPPKHRSTKITESTKNLCHPEFISGSESGKFDL